MKKRSIDLFISADEEVLVSLLLRLGTQNIRAKRLISLSTEFIKDPPSLYDYRPSRASTQTQKMGRRYEKYPATPVSHLPSAGPYALDSYRIFCTGHDDPTSTEWQSVSPGDKEVIRYLVRRNLCQAMKILKFTVYIRNGNGLSKNIESGHQPKAPVLLRPYHIWSRSSQISHTPLGSTRKHP